MRLSRRAVLGTALAGTAAAATGITLDAVAAEPGLEPNPVAGEPGAEVLAGRARLHPHVPHRLRRPRQRPPATLFSSYDAQTVDTHFRWMRENGLDTAALQRFNPTGGEGPTRDLVTARVRDAAEAHGRKFYIMYDVSGWTTTSGASASTTTTTRGARRPAST